MKKAVSILVAVAIFSPAFAEKTVVELGRMTVNMPLRQTEKVSVLLF